MRLKQKSKKTKQKGTALITLLVFTAIAVVVISGAITATISSTQSSTVLLVGDSAYYAAEAGIEEAVLRVLRDPNYTATNETLTINSATVTINVTGTTTKTITSQSNINSVGREIQATGTISNSQFTISSWQEL